MVAISTGAKPETRYDLCLYVAGQTERSLRAIANLKAICEKNLDGGQYDIEIVDLIDHPERAVSDQILALPTLVRRLPLPLTKIIGDLSNEQRVLVGLDIHQYTDG